MMPDDMLLNIDQQILDLLIQIKEAIESLHQPGLQPADIKNSDKKLQNARKQLTELIALYESGKLETIKRQDAPLSIKLIPNSDRISIEKA